MPNNAFSQNMQSFKYVIQEMKKQIKLMKLFCDVKIVEIRQSQSLLVEHGLMFGNIKYKRRGTTLISACAFLNNVTSLSGIIIFL